MARARTAVPRAFLAVSMQYKHWPFILRIIPEMPLQGEARLYGGFEGICVINAKKM